MWALLSPDGAAPIRMVGVSASVNRALHHKVQKFSSDTGSPGWSQKKGRKTVVVWCGVVWCNDLLPGPRYFCIYSQLTHQMVPLQTFSLLSGLCFHLSRC